MKKQKRLLPQIWKDWPDEKLLKLKLSELDLSIDNSPLLIKCINRLYKELEKKQIRFRPYFWLSNEWFTPDHVPGTAIPFYLAHPRLARLEKSQMLDVEGGTEDWCMKILRHETGHTLENAFSLRRKKKISKVFGPFSKPYPQFYTPRPYSRKFVLHLDTWYAQSHPDEDFAETFAVWLAPRSDWKIRYIGWPAMKKLEFMDSLMSELAGKRPQISTRKKIDPLFQIQNTLEKHYQEKRYHFGIHHPYFYDRDLRKLFTEDPPTKQKMTAAAFLRKVRIEVRRKVAEWTGTYQYMIDNVIDDMIERSEDLQLYLKNPVEQTIFDFTVLLTVQTMNYLHSGQHRVAL